MKVVGIIFSKSKSVQKKCSGTPRKHPGNTRETPGKHPGNTQETPMKTPHKRSRFRKKKSLAKLVGILNKEKEKNIAPGKHPGNNQGKVHLLMLLIKGKKNSLSKVQTRLEFGDNYANLCSSVGVLDNFGISLMSHKRPLIGS